MTIPGPPPKGRSSTLACLLSAQSRMSWRWYSAALHWAALPRMLALSTPGNISGNRVRMSIRMDRAMTASGGLGLELLSGLGLDADAAQQPLDRITGLRADAQPVIDAIDFEIQLLVFGC